MQQVAFKVDINDNVATALGQIESGEVVLRGEVGSIGIFSLEKIPMGHKIALKDIKKEDSIIKYGIKIGIATQNISKGSWVHLHCMESLYDKRSSSLDIITGAPTDIKYE